MSPCLFLDAREFPAKEGWREGLLGGDMHGLGSDSDSVAQLPDKAINLRKVVIHGGEQSLLHGDILPQVNKRVCSELNTRLACRWQVAKRAGFIQRAAVQRATVAKDLPGELRPDHELA